MIWTIMQLSLRRLLHNRIELLLTFVVPIAFFSVFALIFGNGIGSGTTPKVKVVIIDEVQSPDSTAIVESLRNSAGLRLMNDDLQDEAFSVNDASDMVRHGSVTIAIVLKSGQGESIRSDLLADASDQVAGQVVSALVGRELVIAKTRQAARARRTLVRRPPTDEATAVPNQPVRQPPAVAAESLDPSELVQIVDVIGEDKANPVVSMYAAGIAVMFLLFGATGGGGVLLDERENTTLDRLLSTELTMDQLLLGKWFYLTALGFVQVCVMFVWGQYVFGIDLLGHLDGFVMMTLVTSSAAAAFGLFLATLCKTRGQLNGLSVILILTMSALGGSMVPRYVMSERMRELGLWTFNAWALDGYDKVFWRDLPADALLPQLAVLMIAAVGFLLVARALAIRWEFD
ncbi:ABC transporter permease [Stieleria sp. ICT_E10.1]|nr:ABC transporter permease [Stieleria sedimenti]MCS7468355.1 ABC transporter permease [Stieleria sedimenti]